MQIHIRLHGRHAHKFRSRRIASVAAFWRVRPSRWSYRAERGYIRSMLVVNGIQVQNNSYNTTADESRAQPSIWGCLRLHAQCVTDGCGLTREITYWFWAMNRNVLDRSNCINNRVVQGWNHKQISLHLWSLWNLEQKCLLFGEEDIILIKSFMNSGVHNDDRWT